MGGNTHQLLLKIDTLVLRDLVFSTRQLAFEAPFVFSTGHFAAAWPSARGSAHHLAVVTMLDCKEPQLVVTVLEKWGLLKLETKEE